MTIWALKWQDRSDEFRGHLLNADCLPVLFRTRKDAREYADYEYGYIKIRKDLRSAPHFWRMPKPVRVKVNEIS